MTEATNVTGAEDQPVEPAPSAQQEILVTDPKLAAALDAEFKGIPAFTDWVGLPVDYESWTAKFAEFEERRTRTSKESLAQGVEVALRAAAIDTGAIEGLYSLPANFTITVATRAPGWDAMVDSMPETFKTLFPSQLRAYELAMSLARSPTGVTEAWVRDLHKELCASQRTYRVITAVGPQEHELPVGEYKHHPNHVKLPDETFHAYASVDATRHEMPKMMEWLKDPRFLGANAALQAAYAHFCLVAIHPFADGNGRVARALASTYLCRAAGVPLVIFDDQKKVYFDALREADHGQFTDFVSFIVTRSTDSLEFVSNLLGASPRQQADRLTAVLRGSGGLTPTEVDLLAIKLLDLVQTEMLRQVGQLDLPTGVNFQMSGRNYSQPNVAFNDDRYRRVGSASQGDLVSGSLWSQSPQMALNLNLLTLAAKTNIASHLCAVRVVESGRMIEARQDEMLPQPTAALQFKVRSWVERTIAEALSDFATKAEQQLRQ
jgi:Fic family protein